MLTGAGQSETRYAVGETRCVERQSGLLPKARKELAERQPQLSDDPLCHID